MNKRLLNFILAVSIFFILASCASREPARPRTLTEKELRVRIEAGAQEVTLHLNEKCKVIKSDIKRSFPDDDRIRIHAAAIDANVAQILYSINNTSFKVKFWSCP